MNPYYFDDACTIYLGDCKDILSQLPKVDLVLTDPPYGIKADKGFSGQGGFGGKGIVIKHREYTDDWDSIRPAKEIFELILNLSQNAIIFGGNFFADILPQGKHWIVWDKLNTMPTFGDCELIWTNIKRNSVKKITFEYNGLIGREAWRAHPTQKPLKLMTRLIETYTQPDQLILDPFMGSGTILRAAKDLGRKAIGIEIEEKYCEIADLVKKC
jgi:DNA modification methylase